MSVRPTGRGAELTAVMIAPDRDLAAQFLNSVAESKAFQIVADLKHYLPEQTLEMRLRQWKPDTLLLDTYADIEHACSTIAAVLRISPECAVGALHRSGDSDAILRVLRAGAVEFLHAPFE